MAAFATTEWIAEIASRAAGVHVPNELTLVIEQRIHDGPAWHFQFADGSLTVGDGPTANPDISLTSSAATATAIHNGTLSAQRAFLDGALQIGGDVTLLMTNRSVLASIGELMAGAT